MTDHAALTAEGERLHANPITSRADLGKEFALLLGMDHRLPANAWRPVGDPDILTTTIQLTCEWVDRARLGYAVPELPGIPQEDERDEAKQLTGKQIPARGTHDTFQVVMRAVAGGWGVSTIQSEWNTQHRRFHNATQGAPGFKGLK